MSTIAAPDITKLTGQFASAARRDRGGDEDRCFAQR